MEKVHFISFRKIYNNWPIKWKLAALILLAATALSFTRYNLLHETFHASLSHEESDFVYARLHALRAIIQNKPDYIDIIRSDIEWEGAYVAFPEYYLRITDSIGRVLVETPGMEKMIPSQWSPFPYAQSAKQHNTIRQAPNGRYFLLLSDKVDPPSGEPDGLIVQIALDVTTPTEIDNANHVKIMVILLLESLAFFFVSVLIIHTQFRPLEEMVRVADEITFANIADRTDPKDWPREVRVLAVSFNGMLDRLESAFSRLSQFTSNMAHEFRTPIHNFLGEAEIVLSRERTPEEYQKALASGMEEFERLSRLVNGLLLIARAENPTNAVQRTLFDPVKEVRDIIGFIEPMIEQKEAEITCRGEGQLYGDPLLFRRAVSNLMTNALDYSPDGVRIDVTITEAEDRFLEVAVSDTGYGIEEKDLARIFDRFYRADGSRSNHPEGSGIGLSIVRAIMELHGGSITIRSTPGEGTTAILRFPPHSPEKQQATGEKLCIC